MAKFDVKYHASHESDIVFGDTSFSGSGNLSSGLTSEDIMSVLRPAAERLAEHYKTTILQLFKRRTGSLADSIKLSEGIKMDRAYMDSAEASIHVGPTGKHKGSRRAARSRAGDADRKYAKHKREAKATSLSNAELGYLLEFGTPRITATHWLENTNDAVEDEIQGIIDNEFTELLKRKGLI